MLSIKGVAKSYPQQPDIKVLQDIHLSLAKGESLALMGASGSGKSTLLHILGGMDRPSQGEIWFKQQPLHNASDAQLCEYRRCDLGFVFQQFNLLPTLTVIDNILFPRRLLGLAEQDEHLQRLLDQLQLQPLLSRWPDELSGGQQQRVAIARALAHRPGLILADEPTGNLDDQMSRTVVSLLKTLCQQAGSALVMATHSREMAAYLDRSLLLKDGRLQAEPQVMPITDQGSQRAAHP